MQGRAQTRSTDKLEKNLTVPSCWCWLLFTVRLGSGRIAGFDYQSLQHQVIGVSHSQHSKYDAHAAMQHPNDGATDALSLLV